MNIRAEIGIPSADELLRRAEAMIPALAERAARTEHDRMVPVETVAEMKEAGFFRVLQPRRYGGYEMSPNVFIDIVCRLAQGCMSTAWIYGIQGAQPFLLALFDDRTQRDVWGEDSSSLMCSTFQPATDVKVVDGGYVISGRWNYLSGSHYSDWVGVGGIVPEDAPGAGDRLVFLLPRQDWQIVDVWDVAGLQGTGSNDVVAQNAFVPQHRTVKMADVLSSKGPGLAVNTAPMYRIPFAQVFIHGATNTAVGALRGMFDLFKQHGAKRVAVNGAKTAEDPVALLLCAEVTNALDEIELVRRRNFEAMMAYVERGEAPTISERQQYKFQTSYAVERCSLFAARIFKASGSSAIFNRQPFGRILANINAGRQHAACQYEGAGRNWATPMLGGAPRPDFMV